MGCTFINLTEAVWLINQVRPGRIPMTYSGTIIKDLLGIVDDCLQNSARIGWRATAGPNTRREFERPSTDRFQNEGDLESEESAAALELPIDVVRRDLRVAQAWVQRELNQASNRTTKGDVA